RLLAIPLFAAALSGYSLPAEAPPGQLGLKRGVIKFRETKSGDVRHSVLLKGAFLADQLSGPFDPASHAVEVHVGGVPVCSVAAGSDAATWRAKANEKWKCRVAGASGDGPSVKLALNLKAGRVKILAKPLDLSSVRNAGPDAVAVSLRIGEALFEGQFAFAEKRKRWTYRSAGFVFQPVLPPGSYLFGEHELARIEAFAANYETGKPPRQIVIRDRLELERVKDELLLPGGLTTVNLDFEKSRRS
ncbi:MAG: hypothetical protein ACYS99_18390, partial [Planctomycetota bacterium]